jgi:DNA-binding CsgD family transcriptional regulator
VVQFVAGTSDPAFAVDGLGNIVAWNEGAAETLAISRNEAIGRPCYEVICGTDENGAICSHECIVTRSANNRRPMGNFDLRIDTPKGEKWFNVTPIIVDVNGFTLPFTIHIMRQIDIYKRLEILLRDFVLSKTNIPREHVSAILSSATSVVREASLTKRELEILHLIEQGGTSVAISEKLNISTSTVDNHVRHILTKLSAHSRLEAVRRAEHSGLL